ncbi:MAG: EAL domain-containing protein [Acidobacteria bacterium]|nr:EAL domain-containing protein [Acidobacteriota bacterium]MBK7933569.1 EAL domain-containing protein [Acidobacteriota bacterium]
MNFPKITKSYMTAVIALGVICVSLSFLTADYTKIDVHLALLFVFTVAIGSRITIQIPRFKSYISASETFIFLALLSYGGEFAVILAAAEAFVTSWRFCKKKTTVFFNTATMAVSTSAVVLVLQLAGLYTENQLHGDDDYRQSFVIALSVIALTQFFVNTSLASVYGSLRDSNPLWETWKNKYIWSFFTYFVGAACAGLLVQLAAVMGFGIIVATFPVCFFVFMSYRMYMKNVEISMQQAEQAEQYAKILESQSDALRESEERFRSAFDYAPIGIGLLTSSGKWLKVNHALTEILGYSESDFMEMDFQSITLPEDLGLTLVKIHELIAGKIASCQMEQRYIHKTGRTVWTSWSVSAASDVQSKQPNLIFQIQDITDKKSAEEKLQHEATHDALTSLPNRPFFMSRLSSALEKVRHIGGYKVSVLFIDLDRFKVVNDSLGHLIGDELLKGIAERLRECMRPSDIVARLGGDEFTILVEGTYDEREVTRIAERIQQKFGMPFNLDGHEVYSSASIGILHASHKHLTSEDMMRDADTAMYQAKRAGKARHAIFDEEMHKAAREMLQLETDLRRAVERNEITVHYQPIYDLATGNIEGIESLARWNHPMLGPISPSKFIPLAEEIGLIDTLCEQVLRQACNEVGSLHDRRSKERQLSLSVNLSCRQFAQSTLVQSICGILDATAFSPEHLKLEITESVFFEHADRAIGMLNKLRTLGVDINIDDFGTGYSNLSYLMKLPISTLKIDRSFISMVDDDGSNDEIVKAIVNLARNLDLRVVAEGIETESQLRKLKELNCEGGQGFFFAAPMNFPDLMQFLRRDAAPSSGAVRFEDIPTILTVQ